MNRTKKCCIYRDCDTNNQTHPERTLFQFPKHEERAAKWCELGAIDPFDARPRFMCELHFSRIYMCFSARRKMLLNTAIPRTYGTTEDDQDPEEVQSSSNETDLITMEEHLDENTMDECDELATEIIYMDAQDLEDDQEEPIIPRKRPHSVESTSRTKVIKVEQLSSISRSMVVSSSSTKSKTLVEDSRNPIALTPPEGTILRRIKLKKRSSAPKPIIVKSVKPSSIVQDTAAAAAAEVAVSSSPEKKASTSDSEGKEEEKNKESVSPVKATSAVASSSNSTAFETSNNMKTEKAKKKPQANSIPQKKDESIYEFIFRGEEYVQLPKATFYGERKKLEERLEQSAKEKEQLEKKIEYYRRAMKDLNEFMNNICEDDDYDD